MGAHTWQVGVKVRIRVDESLDRRGKRIAEHGAGRANTWLHIQRMHEEHKRKRNRECMENLIVLHKEMHSKI